MPSRPVVARLLLAGPLVLAHDGRVPQEPTLHAVLTEALSSHETLHSQVALLAKGRELLVC